MFPTRSVTVYSSVVIPTGNESPDVKPVTSVCEVVDIPQSSDPIGAVNVITSLHVESLLGHTIVGATVSFGITLKVQVVLLPEES